MNDVLDMTEPQVEPSFIVHKGTILGDDLQAQAYVRFPTAGNKLTQKLRRWLQLRLLEDVRLEMLLR
jgi:hypothetical protein